MTASIEKIEIEQDDLEFPTEDVSGIGFKLSPSKKEQEKEFSETVTGTEKQH